MKILAFQDIKKLFPDTAIRTYPAGQIVLFQGDRPNHVFYIKCGSLKMYDIDENGSERVLYVFAKGSILPIDYALGLRKEVKYFYSTIEESDLGMIDIGLLQKRLKTDVALSNTLLAWFLRENENLYDRLNSIIQPDARQKILAMLLYLANNHGTKKPGFWYSVNFPISQQIIADMVGLTRETVSSTLKQLEQEKIVKNNKYLQLKINKKAVSRSLN